MNDERILQSAPLILALDTSTRACSVALHRRETLYSKSEVMSRGHAEALMSMIVDGLDAVNENFNEVDLIAVGIGPGAFTGIRIGIAAARGIAMVHNTPCVGVTSIDAIAASVPLQVLAGRKLLIAIDTKRGDYYAAGFDCRRVSISIPVVAASHQILQLANVRSPVVIAGDAACQVSKFLAAQGVITEVAAVSNNPEARFVAICAEHAMVQGSERHPPTPVYLRGPKTGRSKAPIRYPATPR